MPVEFLSDEQVAGYARFVGEPSPAELDDFFVLSAADRVVVDRRQAAHLRLGFAVQLCTARHLARS